MSLRRTVPPLLITALTLLVLLGISIAANADLAVEEMALNPEGSVYDVNADAGGVLWISDNGAEEIWTVDPPTGVYTVYYGVGPVSDARRATDGGVWWIDQTDQSLRRLWPHSSEFTTWTIPGASTLFGTAIDQAGTVWLSQASDPEVYRFAVASSKLCTYTLGAQGGSNYVLAESANVWLADWIGNSVHRVEGNSDVLTSWALPTDPFLPDARPEGLAVDGEGHVWWADSDRHHLARLEPDDSRLTTYGLPWGSQSRMVTVSGERVWYTEDARGSVGRLDPALASGSSQTILSDTVTLTPECSQISPDATGVLTTTTGTAAWASTAYTSVVDADGWSIHELPPDAYPWGIAASGGELWMVDTGRQVLARIEDSLSVTACKVADEDGELSTGDDRTPLEGWTMYMLVDGARQEPRRETGPDGCVTWDGLDPGVSYGVEEETHPDWIALTPTTHSFGVGSAGDTFGYVFVNAEIEEEYRIYLPLVIR